MTLRGTQVWCAKLTDVDVIAIRRRYAAGDTLATLAAAYPQCSKVNLHHIVRDRRWRHLPRTSSMRVIG
ncbi:hypothetical protein SAMN06295912_15016 [Sphingomonas laterariae]|uniref:Uncharacterized protein n=1 Tax=Edaphosphingomonas laterariae TaxID=861865 RepID=A0A239KBY7_9SPHN|nr:hypothetical protein [Sphingomonas laterariae]SNT15916.1 hypothetical protein SAMN06295912_15016 [Sphingomonas laterariae]